MRRQVLRAVRKPLIVMAPKSLLRSRDAYSPVEDFVEGTFREVLDDPAVTDPESVRRVLLCSGKIAYKAIEHRVATGAPVAIVRVEQLYPWPGDQIADVLARYTGAVDVFWLQEEPENMGAWTFVRERLRALLRDDFTLTDVARLEAGSPGAGSSTYHELEEADLLQRAFAGP
jgi:2-oxoglutarate dehydrogenase E1 component